MVGVLTMEKNQKLYGSKLNIAIHTIYHDFTIQLWTPKAHLHSSQPHATSSTQN